jgi:hypothetical protein
MDVMLGLGRKGKWRGGGRGGLKEKIKVCPPRVKVEKDRTKFWFKDLEKLMLLIRLWVQVG